MGGGIEVFVEGAREVIGRDGGRGVSLYLLRGIRLQSTVRYLLPGPSKRRITMDRSDGRSRTCTSIVQHCEKSTRPEL